MLSTPLILIAVLAFFVVVGVLWLLNARRFYRDLKPAATLVDPAVDALDTRRQDLAAELVRTVKAQPSYDHEALDALIAASLADAASASSDRADADSGLEGTINQLLKSANAYPELGANPDFQRIKQEFALIFGQDEAIPGSFASGSPVGPRRALDAAEARTDMGALSGNPLMMVAGLDAAEGVAATSLFATDKGPSAAERKARYAKAAEKAKDDDAGDKASPPSGDG
jgi:LemA protein